MNLTPKQALLAAFIRDFLRTHDYAPSLDEMAKHFGVSRITIHERLGGLEKRGVLRRSKYQARAIELLDRVTIHALPLLGYIAAGEPIEATENKEDVDVGEMLDTGKEQYVLKVRGTSMIDEQIRDGDYVIVEKRDRARNGETVVALVNGSEATLKKFYREKDGRIRLQPANPDMPPIFPRDVKIQGVVIGVVRKY
jgi:repressor LexA